MTRRRHLLAISLPAFSATLLAMSIAAGAATPDALADTDAGSGNSFLLVFVLVVAAFSGVGTVVALRLPDNPIGWLLAAVGLLFALVAAASISSVWVLETGSLSRDLGEWISLAGNLWVPALGIIGIHLPLRLPDGTLPSPRWRWFSRVTLALIAISFVGMATQPGKVEGIDGTANPIGSETLKPIADVFFLVILSFVGGVAGLVVRYRRASDHERVQLRWVAFGGAVFLAIYIATQVIGSLVAEHSVAGNAVTFVAGAAFAALPIAIGYAILRHRLYDIDVVINRALVYGALTATLAATYLGTVLLLQLALNGITGDSGLAIAASTLAVAALFRPARARIQATVDRRFFRRKYDAQRTLESFSARLRDEIGLDAVTDELRTVVTETMQPAHVSLWLSAGERAP
jgi:hypothetical protein